MTHEPHGGPFARKNRHDVQTQGPFYRDCNFVKLCVMMSMVSVDFVVELGVGIFGGSLALMADSFHMLSDALGLVIAMLSIVVRKFFSLFSSHL